MPKKNGKKRKKIFQVLEILNFLSPQIIEKIEKSDFLTKSPGLGKQ